MTPPPPAPFGPKQVVILCIFLWPTLACMLSVEVAFIPNPIYRLPCALLGLAYILVPIVWVGIANRKGMAARSKENGGIPVMIFGLICLVGGLGWSNYHTLYVGAPALFTKVFGSAAHRDFQIDDLYRAGFRAPCRYQIEYKGVPGQFCAPALIWRQGVVGQDVRLSGKETSFGFFFNFESLDTQSSAAH